MDWVHIEKVHVISIYILINLQRLGDLGNGKVGNILFIYRSEKTLEKLKSLVPPVCTCIRLITFSQFETRRSL